MKLKQLLTALFIGIATFSANAKDEESNKGKQPAAKEQATSHAIDCDCQACVNKQPESANAAPKNAAKAASGGEANRCQHGEVFDSCTTCRPVEKKDAARVIDKGPLGKCLHGTPRGATCYRCGRGDKGQASGSAATGPAKAPKVEGDKTTPTKQGGAAEKAADHRIPNPQKPTDGKKKPAAGAEPAQSTPKSPNTIEDPRKSAPNAEAAKQSGGNEPLCTHEQNPLRCTMCEDAKQGPLTSPKLKEVSEEKITEKAAAPRDTYDDGPRVPIKKK